MKSLQFRLDRQTLQTIYFSFIRPILEYGSPVWDGSTSIDADKLERIQLTAARIVTGAMHGTSNAKLYEELGWQTLASRREQAKLSLMYKIIHKLVPNYLQSIIPYDANQDFTYYTTRQRFDLPHFRARTDLYNNSFFPSTVRLWNEIPIEIRNLPSLSLFKSKLREHFGWSNNRPEYYNFGERYSSILHTRLRLGSSQLNSHLFKIGVKTNASCQCGANVEDAWHYFFSCPRYTILRSQLHNSISLYAPFTLQTVLYGSPNCTLTENMQIFSAVQTFITMSGRFSQTAIG